jgi:hypothetical protein
MRPMSFARSPWLDRGGWRRPSRVPLSLVTSLFRYAALRGGGSLDYYVVQRGCTLSMLAVFVARCKRSAPAKHPARGAGEASEICLITVA